MGKKPNGHFRIALAGQPNSGKTSLFNGMTGSTGHVGNYAGATVEKREGRYTFKGQPFDVLDLPGSYSLSSFSPEEKIAQREILENTPDVVVVVVDSTSLTRGLVFFAQVAHTGVNTVLALNMADEAKASGQRLNIPLMSELLGCPVVETIARRRTGIDTLKSAIETAVHSPNRPRPPVLGQRLGHALDAIEKTLVNTEFDTAHRAWTACRILNNDADTLAPIKKSGDSGKTILLTAERQRDKLREKTGEDVDVFIAERYFGFAHGLVTEVMQQRARSDSRAASDLVDRFLAHKILGLPVFIGVMYGIFWTTFTVGDIPMGWLETTFAAIGGFVGSHWPQTSYPSLRSLLLDGVIAGVGGVVVFLPNIVLLFLGLALLEDTGYMARAAFLMDQLMHRFGLHGKSFLPLLTGFGCSIPGIMATRTLENERDRLTTLLVLPLMSCGARLPIWMLLVPAFFPASMRTPALMTIYLTGALLALGLALLLRKTVFQGTEAPFVMELPPYRLPTIRGLGEKMTERSWLYLRKAGTVILAISMVMWFITSYPKPHPTASDSREPEKNHLASVIPPQQPSNSDRPPRGDQNEEAMENLRASFAGQLGQMLEPILSPLGFDWRLATAMVGAFAAKEVFVAQMGIVHALGETDGESTSLRQHLADNYSPLVGISLILFLLIATPCMATVAVTKRETGKWKWALFQFGGLTVLAYIISLIVFQGGSLLGWG